MFGTGMYTQPMRRPSRPQINNTPPADKKATRVKIAKPRTEMSGTLDVWEGFWAGWKPRWCVLKDGDFVVYSDEKSMKEIARISVRGEGVRTSIDTRRTPGMVEETSARVGTGGGGPKRLSGGASTDDLTGTTQDNDKYMSFITHTPQRSHHVHVRAASIMERDNWLLTLINMDGLDIKSNDVAITTALQHHLATTNVYCELLDNQVAKLSKVNEILTAHEEIFSLFRETQVAAMTAHSVRITFKDALDWCGKIELWYERENEVETRRQREIRELASWCIHFGRDELLPVANDRGVTSDESDVTASRALLATQFETELLQLGVYREGLSAHSTSVSSRMLNVKKLITVTKKSPQMKSSNSAQLSASKKAVEAMDKAVSSAVMVDASLRAICSEYNNAISAVEERVSELSTNHAHTRAHTNSLWRAVVQTVAEQDIPTAGVKRGATPQPRRKSNTMDSIQVPEQMDWKAAVEKGLDSFEDLEKNPDLEVPAAVVIPELPMYDAYTVELIKTTYRCDLQSMYDVMFSSHCPGLLAFYQKCEYFDIQLGAWTVSTDDILVSTRENYYSITLDTPLGRKTSNTVEEATLTWNAQKTAFVVDSKITAKGVPYGDAFYSRVKYVVKSSGEKTCDVTLSTQLEWVSKPYFSKITNMLETTVKETMSDFGDSCHKHMVESINGGMMDEVYLNEVPERPPVNVLMPVIKKKVASRSASRTSSKRTDKKKSDIGRLIQNESLVPGPTLLSTLSVMSAALSVGALVMGLRLRYHGA